MNLGIVGNLPPAPFKPENTRMVEAGALRFGVEYRHITVEQSRAYGDSLRAKLRAKYAADPVALARYSEPTAQQRRTIDDGGVSIHVFGADDGHEYLRFDCFDEEPHYHYNHRVGPGEVAVNHIIRFDAVACGEMLLWTLAMLRERLPQMLAEARGAALAERIDAAAVRRALEDVARLAQEPEARSVPDRHSATRPT